MEDLRFAEMISKIGHELRSPLTSIKGFSTTLLLRWERFGDEQKRELVGMIAQEADRMARIINEILDLARIESGRLEINPVVAPVAEIARKAADYLGRLTAAERIEIDIAQEISAWADPARLEHVLVNLLENAIKFSDAGPIKVAARREDGNVAISISDQGVGILPERLESLFSGPAPRTGPAATPSGSGLGLYLARRLVDAHGGSIEVASIVEVGSTFTVRLPAEAKR